MAARYLLWKDCLTRCALARHRGLNRQFASFEPNQPSPQMSKYTAFRCPEDLLELAKVKAKKDRRSLSNYIITLIEKDVQDELEAAQKTTPPKK